ncbi:MAG: hypothetical protein V4621_03100 [Pseudomonadota bacterium]
MFRHPPRNNDNSPRFIYLHRLERIFDNRPVKLAMAEYLSIRRRIFLLKRWRDDRTVYLMSFFPDLSYIHDATLRKINLNLECLRRQRERSRHNKSRLMERISNMTVGRFGYQTKSIFKEYK